MKKEARSPGMRQHLEAGKGRDLWEKSSSPDTLILRLLTSKTVM
jgi:hypothetical protein